jgi:hypothetical protein
VAEVGPGHWGHDASVPLNATLLAFEINSRFSRHLKSNVADARLDAVNASVG